MRSDTKTIAIHAKPDRVVDFLAEPMNLPRWAVGFAKKVHREQDRWVVTTGSGEMGIRIDADRKLGVVDFFMSPVPGVEAPLADATSVWRAPRSSVASNGVARASRMPVRERQR